MKFLKKLAVATAALAGLGGAQAAVLSFDAAIDTSGALFAPLLTHGDEVLTQGFWIDTFSTKAGAAAGDLVGALVDGSDAANTCAGLVCPSNNASKYLVAVNDGYPDIGLVSGALMRFTSFDASFVAASGDAVPPVALILRVEGYQGANIVVQQDFNVPGPTAGSYSFATYTLNAAFAGTDLTDVGFRGFACNAAGSCNRTSDKAQFALDNLTINAVPEPAEWMLMALGLVAVGALARRRNAA